MENVPAKQLEHAEDAAGEYLPAEQSPAVTTPSVAQYFPAKHGVQELEPVSLWNRPILQLEQLKDAIIEVYIPAEHETQLVEEDVAAYLPTSQAAHEADEKAPANREDVPAEHLAQEDAPALA